MTERALARVATGVFTAIVALFATVAVFSAFHGWHGDRYAPVVYLAWAATGFILATRRPRNIIGWLFLAAILSWAVSGFGGHYGRYGLETAPGSLPGALWAYWVSTWTWIPGLVLIPTFGLLLFPDGRLPSSRWRWVAWPLAAGIGLMAVSYLAVPWQGNDEFAGVPAGVDNPLLATPLADLHEPLFLVSAPLVLAGIVAAVIALIVRYRRARGAERQQLKWVVFGGTVAVAIYLTGDLTTRIPGVEWWLLTLAATLVFPASILVAILRYRLYDIDRIVSRTVSYALLTALLVGVYAAGVVGLGGLATQLTGGGGDLAVAASTLAVAGLFGPARRRIQRGVDRRFNRARYDAGRTVEAFSQRLRDEVDLDALARDLGGVVAATLGPSSVSLWLRGGAGARAPASGR